MVFNTLRPPKASLPPPSPSEGPAAAEKEATIVLMAGFEAFNVQLYRKAAAKLAAACPRLRLVVFTDRDIAEQPEAVAAELARADVFFGSLIFDYDQVGRKGGKESHTAHACLPPSLPAGLPACLP